MSELKDPFGWVGQTIDDAFIVEEVVGEGGFAVVYRGHHKGFDEKVAIKALKFPSKLGEEERKRFLESFTSEGKLLRKLSSADAGVVQALDVGVATSPNGTWTPYLILEWLEGETLEADLKKRREGDSSGRSLADAIALLEPAAKGLQTAHDLGIAHRDVKPSNLFLVNKGDKRTLKVVDFGIAKVMTDSEDVMRAYEATGESIHAFSPRYGAPEQFDRKYGATGPWTDVFALALVLVEVVAGKSAMKGDTSQLFLAASDKAARPTLKSVGVEESDAVEKVLKSALAVDPRERFADAGEFWRALRHATEHGDTVLSQKEGTPTRREGKPETTAAAAKDGGTKPSATAALETTPASRNMQLAVAALMIGALGTASYVVMPHHGLFAEEAPPPEVPNRHLSELSADAAAPAVDPANAAVSAAPGYVRYANTRYNFVVDIPEEFTHFEESNTGDGRTYSNPPGNAVLRVFGGTLVGSLSDMYIGEFEARDHSLDRWILPDHTLTPNMYVVAGYEHDTDPFMEKGIVTGGIYARLYIGYKPESKAHFDTIVPHMRDSFSFTAVSNTTPQPAPILPDRDVSKSLSGDAGSWDGGLSFLPWTRGTTDGGKR